MQVLQGKWDRTFSDHSYGFRPGRSAHQAVAQAQQYIAEGYRWCVDLDLEKFFDRVSHDKLMARIETRVSDRRMLRLIRAFLKVGVMEGGLVSPVDEGTPQGGPMTPRTQKITSNLNVACDSGVNRVRIDACRKRLYIYDRCRAPAISRRPSASITHGPYFGKSSNSQMRPNAWHGIAPSRHANPMFTPAQSGG